MTRKAENRKTRCFVKGLWSVRPTLPAWQCSPSSWGNHVDRCFNLRRWPMLFEMIGLSFYGIWGKYHLHHEQKLHLLHVKVSEALNLKWRHSKPHGQKRIFTNCLHSVFCYDYNFVGKWKNAVKHRKHINFSRTSKWRIIRPNRNI